MRGFFPFDRLRVRMTTLVGKSNDKKRREQITVLAAFYFSFLLFKCVQALFLFAG